MSHKRKSFFSPRCTINKLAVYGRAREIHRRQGKKKVNILHSAAVAVISSISTSFPCRCCFVEQKFSSYFIQYKNGTKSKCGKLNGIFIYLTRGNKSFGKKAEIDNKNCKALFRSDRNVRYFYEHSTASVKSVAQPTALCKD